jgi:hypothetical protein
MRSHGNGHHAPIEETLAFLAPYRPPGNYTVVTVGSNTTYAVKTTDIIVLMDTSLGGQQTATADLGPGKTIGEKHTFIWYGWGNAQTPPTITGTGGATMMPYAGMQSTGLTGLVASNTINQTGGFYTLEWTGAFWAQTG